MDNSVVYPKPNTLFLFFKRVFDVIGACCGMVLFFLTAIILSIIYFFSKKNKGPLIFSQTRIGKDGKEFEIYKFRSMVMDAEEVLKKNKELYEEYINGGYKLDEGRDPRVTGLGSFIRKTSIDELPQFWNVLKGDMALVGPRPVVEEELAEYDQRVTDFLSVKPGLTGVWTVSGRSDVPYPERTDLELSYLNNLSLRNDFKILVKTCIVVLKKEGAH
ncbi:multidrug MFS transporter [Enterococcus sp. JM4C]|uniref:sugar transferase n=1 Tax=Candidatus Enterococcus huntleyi TaxID=1857217 RepID=UPI001379CE01|nr:sugar transferase [Enterococcus sp. JM4C]KAF1297283.1 multidrug MFS transporter [Enterococcus sp. JM4C]